jgi:hypothetical protein
MRALAAALLLGGAPSIVFAQQEPAPPVIQNRPVSGFVIDARGVLTRFGQRPATATFFGVTAAELPGPGLGGSIGAHVYPLRFGQVTLGVGGELMLARRSRQPLDSAGQLKGPKLNTRVYTIAPQISFNFGNRTGWSYVSGGIGTGTFETWADTGDSPDRAVRVINYGGGARWFSSPRFAFTVDLRFYAISPGLASGALPERPRQRLMALSAGVSVR